MRIQLVLSDDWELRGDGSGNMRRVQFDTIRGLCEVYDRHGIRGSFNAEVLQQLTHLRLGDKHPELAALAREWEEVIKDVYRRGHDVQLHLHPQWGEARYADGRWELSDRWSILEYDRVSIDAMLRQAKEYLERLFLEINPSYRCVSFRSGSWCIAPSPDVLPALVHAGVVFDVSLVDGVVFDTQHVKLDYRGLDEAFLPFYPDLEDARRVADHPQPIVCLPTHSFVAKGRPLLMRALARRAARRGFVRYTRRFVAAADGELRNRGYGADYSERTWASRLPASGSQRRSPKRLLSAKRWSPQRHRISDLAYLSFGEMRQMLADIRQKARASGWEVVPVVLENHTKDIAHFDPLERFAQLISRANDIEVLTLTEVARNIERGDYPVRLGRAT